MEELSWMAGEVRQDRSERNNQASPHHEPSHWQHTTAIQDLYASAYSYVHQLSPIPSHASLTPILRTKQIRSKEAANLVFRPKAPLIKGQTPTQCRNKTSSNKRQS